MRVFCQRYSTDLIGDLLLVAVSGILDGQGLAAISFLDDGQSLADALPPRLDGAEMVETVEPFAEVTRWLDRYFTGKAVEASDYKGPIDPGGTDFDRRVWSALREIPHGETRSYGELAAAIGKRGGARAVGGANGRNPLAVLVPCHRVVGANRKLTGFGGGLLRKAALLNHEEALFAASRSR